VSAPFGHAPVRLGAGLAAMLTRKFDLESVRLCDLG
jgi:hypothetical protein